MTLKNYFFWLQNSPVYLNCIVDFPFDDCFLGVSLQLFGGGLDDAVAT